MNKSLFFAGLILFIGAIFHVASSTVIYMNYNKYEPTLGNDSPKKGFMISSICFGVLLLLLSFVPLIESRKGGYRQFYTDSRSYVENRRRRT